jgi:hypothetical protein
LPFLALLVIPVLSEQIRPPPQVIVIQILLSPCHVNKWQSAV